MNKAEEAKSAGRTPARKLTREDLRKVTGGVELIQGCCTQDCCGGRHNTER
jgi:hypothetical protein